MNYLLYYIILCFIILYYIILCFIILYYVLLYYIILHYIILYIYVSILKSVRIFQEPSTLTRCHQSLPIWVPPKTTAQAGSIQNISKLAGYQNLSGKRFRWSLSISSPPGTLPPFHAVPRRSTCFRVKGETARPVSDSKIKRCLLGFHTLVVGVTWRLSSGGCPHIISYPYPFLRSENHRTNPLKKKANQPDTLQKMTNS